LAWILVSLFGVSVATLFVACAVGAIPIPLNEQLRILIDALTRPMRDSDLSYAYLFIRLPRVLTTFLVGMSLACVGALFQSLLRNPLAEPYIIGVSPGASLGATVFLAVTLEGGRVTMTAGQLSGMTFFAFAGGLLAVAAAYVLASRGRFLNLADVLLAGIAIGSICTAATSYLWIRRLQDIRGLLYWLMGNLSGRSWSHVGLILVLAVPSVAVCWRLASGLNVMLLGEEHAAYLGLNVERFKRGLLALGTLTAAGTVAVAGVIGFVGIIVPHFVRRVVGADNRRVIPTASLVGGVFLVWCDMIARTLFAPLELPVGMVTALLGAPFFLYILRQTQQKA
jgi:iron complex transport system permease protein